MLDGVVEYGELRAADADRERVAERLRSALDEGRLTLSEYDDRLREAYQAKTYADLDRLLVDLPATAPVHRSAVVPAETSLPVPAPARPTAAWLATIWGSWLQVVAICVGIWFASSLVAGWGIPFWPAFVAVPWGMVLVFMTVGGLASGEPQKWAAKRASAKRKKRKRPDK